MRLEGIMAAFFRALITDSTPHEHRCIECHRASSAIDALREEFKQSEILARAERKQETFAELKRYKLERNTFRAVAAYTVLTGILLILAYKQLQISRMSDRPWVGLSQISFQTPSVGKPFIVTIAFENAGKSPAVNVIANDILEIVPKGTKASAPPNPCDTCHGDVWIPSVPVVRGPNLNGNIMTPDVIAENSHTLDWNSRANSMVLIGQVTYESPSGEKHETNFCYLLAWSPTDFITCPADWSDNSAT